MVLFSLRLGTSGNLCCSAYDFSVWLLCVAGVLCMVWRAAGGLVGGVRPASWRACSSYVTPFSLSCFVLLFELTCLLLEVEFGVGRCLGGCWCGVLCFPVCLCVCVSCLCVSCDSVQES